MALPPNRIADRYEPGELIGVGGMGAVYLGVDTLSGKEVAIKRLKADVVATDPSVVERFKREADALRQLNHPNIVKVFDTHTGDDGDYIIMEFVEGGNLAQLIRSTHPLEINHVLDIALGLADALARAHTLKIVHRDIKPVNVLIAADGTPKLTDFGVAYLGSRDRMTATGTSVGTLDYLSPEALNGEAVDARTDIWAFGVLLYEMLAGAQPFARDSATQTIVAILHHPMPEISHLREDVPPALQNLLSGMLQKDRDQRIASARLIGAELEALRNGTGTPLKVRFTTPLPGMMTDAKTVVFPNPPSSGLQAVAATAERTAPLTTNPVIQAAASPNSTLIALAVVGILVVIIGGLLLTRNNAVDTVSVDPTIAAPTEVPTQAPTRPVVTLDNLPEGWRTYQSNTVSVGLPTTWVQLAGGSVVSGIADQMFSTFGDLAEKIPQFVEFAKYIVSPERVKLLATEPVSLTFLVVSVEPVGIGMNMDILKSRLDGLLTGTEDYNMSLTPIQIGDREGYQFSIDVEATSSIRIRAVAYILLNGDNVIWITFGSTTPTQNFDENVALYESIASTLVLGQAAAEATPES